MKYIILAVVLIPLSLFSQIFEDRLPAGEITNEIITEASGLAVSRKNPDVVWIHNDSGANEIYTMNTTGLHLGTFTLENINIRDLEDIAIGLGPEEGEYYIYLGDFGDNNGNYETKYIYRFIEPEIVNAGDGIISEIDTLKFIYPSPNNYDSESLMIDPLTKDIYIITKSKYSSDETPESDKLFKFSYPQNNEITELSYESDINIDHFYNFFDGNYYGSTGADISAYGYEILVRTYNKIYYWERPAEQTITEAFTNTPIICSYNYMENPIEPQGEAICWFQDAMGYYTTTEEVSLINNSAYLSYATRINPPSLPVEISDLFASVTPENHVNLQWETISEANLQGFYVLRSTTENPIEADIISDLIMADNNLNGSNYSYLDTNVLPGMTYYYYIQSNDLISNVMISEPIEVIVTPTNSDDQIETLKLTFLKNCYPNPFIKNNSRSQVKFEFGLEKNEKANLSVFNIRGRKVKDFGYFVSSNKENSFVVEWSLNDTNLPTGIYFYRLQSKNKNETKKLIIFDES